MQDDGPAAPRDPRTFAVLGALIEVQRELGTGFLEKVYQRCAALEMEERRIPFGQEVPLPIRYKGRDTGLVYRADFVCHGSVLVELKAQRCLTDADEAQVLHYLQATGLPVALLVNFGEVPLAIRRFVMGNRLRDAPGSR